ncbi:hypothetical protein Glove_668g33 [Diversispora epigaea]|uniref:Uncharacterized protein n=1 Tax=Diversispora epigaea TaxID=1348612 RepID=A0A397G3M3_9GLOM|nr:hypothetical protein Glove_668g33 [Diversispora epigaea]
MHTFTRVKVPNVEKDIISKKSWNLENLGFLEYQEFLDRPIITIRYYNGYFSYAVTRKIRKKPQISI